MSQILNITNFYFFLQVGYWLAMIGYTIAFSAVLAKMWRVYYIFHNPTPSKRVRKNTFLHKCIYVFSLIDS